ncbi:MAG TPA: hypothetical protein PKM69_04895 [Bacteroidales bacterium]|nr:hypothetical protein [Bacteroidales bacterium]
MRKTNLLLLSLIFLSFHSYSQSTYLVGTSQVSIEPDQSLISLHLAGYGIPKEGRFTLQWIDQGVIPTVTAIGGSNEKLFIVSNNELFVLDSLQNKSIWGKKGKAENIISIAGLSRKLYGMNKNGELLATKINGGAKWEKICFVDHSVTLIATDGNKLFAANTNGSFWSADLSENKIEWEEIESINKTICDIRSITANNGKLYALTIEGTIYQCEPGNINSKWLKIAYRNGVTVKEDIGYIAFFRGRLFGVSKDNHLYCGEHRSEGNLSARSMAIKRNEKTVVIVNVDLCGLNESFTGPLKQEIFLKNHIPSQAVFLNFTHTHFAPVTQDLLTWQEHCQRPDSIYLNSIVKAGILKSIDNALKTMAPAELFFGRGSVDIGYNRSLKDHPELYDNDVDVVKVKYTEKQTESYLFLTACHPVFSTAGTLHYTISANYPGVARKLVEERTRTSNSLFLQGTAGDIDPKDDGEYITGEKLAKEVIAVLDRPMTQLNGAISFYLDTVKIPVSPWPKDKIIALRAENIDKTGDVYAEKNVKWCDLMFKYYNEGTMPGSMPVYIHTINIGNWKLVGFSRETTTGYGLRLKNFWPDKIISVAGYTNDVSSYLPTNMHIEQGVYEGKDSYFWDGMPNSFPKNVDNTILNVIKSLDR